MPVSRFTFSFSSALRHFIGATAMTTLVFGGILVILWAFAHTLARNSDAIQASEFAASLSPTDPLARSRYAADLEKTFDIPSIERSLHEYEAAVAAAPHSYTNWLSLGQARERSGDRLAAESAYRRALSLAPNYARTKWALGNNLVRQGKIDEGVGLIRGAVEQDPTFAGPAAIAAMQAFDGDVQRTSQALGTSPAAVAELAKYLVNAARFDEGLAVWNSAGLDGNVAAVREAGMVVRGKLLAAKRFRDASVITASLEADETKRPLIGSITNGGFETGVTTQNVDFFDWRTAQTYPIFGLSDNQPKEGRYSLLVRFTTPSRREFAAVSRTVAVVPGSDLELSLAYKSDLTTRAEFRWEVISASDAKRLAVSEPLADTSGWTDINLRFAVPLSSDGITIRLVREKCDSAACTVSGSLWFDDFRLTEAE